MMLYPPVPDMLEHVESRYLLVNVIARRAREVAQETETYKIPTDLQPVTQAVHDIADGKLTATLKEEYLR